ncbi:hypothetical protein ACNISN_23370, partial [Escherichia coli]
GSPPHNRNVKTTPTRGPLTTTTPAGYTPNKGLKQTPPKKPKKENTTQTQFNPHQNTPPHPPL